MHKEVPPDSMPPGGGDGGWNGEWGQLGGRPWERALAERADRGVAPSSVVTRSWKSQWSGSACLAPRQTLARR